MNTLLFTNYDALIHVPHHLIVSNKNVTNFTYSRHQTTNGTTIVFIHFIIGIVKTTMPLLVLLLVSSISL